MTTPNTPYPHKTSRYLSPAKPQTLAGRLIECVSHAAGALIALSKMIWVLVDRGMGTTQLHSISPYCHSRRLERAFDYHLRNHYRHMDYPPSRPIMPLPYYRTTPNIQIRTCVSRHSNITPSSRRRLMGTRRSCIHHHHCPHNSSTRNIQVIRLLRF